MRSASEVRLGWLVCFVSVGLWFLRIWVWRVMYAKWRTVEENLRKGERAAAAATEMWIGFNISNPKAIFSFQHSAQRRLHLSSLPSPFPLLHFFLALSFFAILYLRRTIHNNNEEDKGWHHEKDGAAQHDIHTDDSIFLPNHFIIIIIPSDRDDYLFSIWRKKINKTNNHDNNSAPRLSSINLARVFVSVS